jgi:hypothetical protein
MRRRRYGGREEETEGRMGGRGGGEVHTGEDAGGDVDVVGALGSEQEGERRCSWRR